MALGRLDVVVGIADDVGVGQPGGALGAGGVTAATVAGQLTISVVADRLGILDLPEKPITVARVTGVILLGLGVYLIVRE